VNGSEYGRCVIYENRRMKLVEIVLRSGEREEGE
jgi:hypothetical protein